MYECQDHGLINLMTVCVCVFVCLMDEFTLKVIQTLNRYMSVRVLCIVKHNVVGSAALYLCTLYSSNRVVS